MDLPASARQLPLYTTAAQADLEVQWQMALDRLAGESSWIFRTHI